MAQKTAETIAVMFLECQQITILRWLCNECVFAGGIVASTQMIVTAVCLLFWHGTPAHWI